MATGGVLGNGSKVGYSAGSPVSYTRITQVLEIEIPTIVYDEIEKTVHSTGGFKSFMPGLADVTPMKITLLSDLDGATSPTHRQLRNYCIARTTVFFRVEIPVQRGQTTFLAIEFQGYVKEWMPKAPIGDKQTTEVTVRFDDTSFAVYEPGSSLLG